MATPSTDVPKSEAGEGVKPKEEDQKMEGQNGAGEKQQKGPEDATAEAQEHLNSAEEKAPAKKDEAADVKEPLPGTEEAAKENGTEKELTVEEKKTEQTEEAEKQEKLEPGAGDKETAGGPAALKEEEEEKDGGTENMVEDKPDAEEGKGKDPSEVVKKVVNMYGGRHSKVMGIDVDGGGEDAIEQWFLVALLFSRGISTEQTLRTFELLREEGVKTVKDAGQIDYQKLWDKLTEAKAQRTDKTATMLQQTWKKLESEYEGKAANLKKIEDPKEVMNVLKKFQGVGPTTAELFLRELRGVWPAADAIPLNERAISAGQHLGLCGKPSRKRGRAQKGKAGGAGGEEAKGALAEFEQLAKDSGMDLRDLETALIKFHNAHYRSYSRCSKGGACTALSAENAAATADAAADEG